MLFFQHLKTITRVFTRTLSKTFCNEYEYQHLQLKIDKNDIRLQKNSSMKCNSCNIYLVIENCEVFLNYFPSWIPKIFYAYM